MRILVISNLFPPRVLGGFELSAYNLSQALRARGHDVAVITSPHVAHVDDQDSWVERTLALHGDWFEPSPTQEPVARSYRAFASQVSQPANTLLVLDAIRRFRPDQVLTFGLLGLGGLGLLHAVAETGVPVTMNLGDDVPGGLVAAVPDPVRDVYNAHRSGLFASFRYAIVSQRLREEVESSVDLGPSQLVARGVMYADTPRTRTYREGGKTRFTFVGMLAPHKGADLVLQAASVLAAERGGDFSVDFLGGGDIPGYAAMAESLGVTELVSFHGALPQREVVRRHAASDAFVFPTWEREPGASSPGEAAAVGCLPILTGACGPAEWFVDGIHVLKIQREAASLTDAMRRVIVGEVDLETMAAAGRRLTRGALSFDRSAGRLERWLAGAEKPGRMTDLDAVGERAARRHATAAAAWRDATLTA